jgi:hypothetical protein
MVIPALVSFLFLCHYWGILAKYDEHSAWMVVISLIVFEASWSFFRGGLIGAIKAYKEIKESEQEELEK